MKDQYKAHAAVGAANIFYAINYIVMKNVTTTLMTPFALNIVRILGATILFWILYFIKPNPKKIEKKDWPTFLFCAVTGIILNQIMFVKGLALTTPFRASLLMLFTPIAVVFFALFFQKQKITNSKAIGLILGIVGAFIIISLREKTQPGENHLLGDIFIIINATSYALYLIWVKKLSSTYKIIQIIRIVFTISLFTLLPFGYKEIIYMPWHTFTVSNYFAIGFIVIGVTFLAYLFNAYSVRILGSTTTGVYIYSQPVFATLMTILLTGNMEHLGLKTVAAILIFTGLYLVSFKKDVAIN